MQRLEARVGGAGSDVLRVRLCQRFHCSDLAEKGDSYFKVYISSIITDHLLRTYTYLMYILKSLFRRKFTTQMHRPCKSAPPNNYPTCSSCHFS